MNNKTALIKVDILLTFFQIHPVFPTRRLQRLTELKQLNQSASTMSIFPIEM